MHDKMVDFQNSVTYVNIVIMQYVTGSVKNRARGYTNLTTFSKFL